MQACNAAAQSDENEATEGQGTISEFTEVLSSKDDHCTKDDICASARASVDSEASVNASSVNSHADIYQDVNLGANQVQEGGSSLAQKLVQMGTLGAQLNANEE